MVVDTAQDPVLALLDQFDLPRHQASYSHYYVDLSSNTLRRRYGPSHEVGDQSIRYEQLKREIQILVTKLKGKPRLPSPPPLSKPLQEYVSLDMIYPRELCGLPPLLTHVDTRIPTTPINLSLVADIDVTSLARSEASSVSPCSPDSVQWAFRKASCKISTPQNSRHSLCAPIIKASLGDRSRSDHKRINSCDPSDMDSTEEDLDDGDYVEPAKKPRVLKGRLKSSISGDGAPCGSFPCQKLVTHNEMGEPLRKPYPCTNACRTKQILHRHYNLTKHGGTRVKCPHCEEGFSRKDQLGPHLRTRCSKFRPLKGEEIMKKLATRGARSKKPRKTKRQSLRKPVLSLI